MQSKALWCKSTSRLLLVLIAAGACTFGSPNLEEDSRAIEALNQHDTDAVLSSDFDALISQWTDDFVLISRSSIVRGRSANAALMEAARTVADQLEPLEHVLDFKETIVAGDYAIQWGTFRSSSRSRASGEVFSGGGKLMRILQRQADGAWKMHRTMTVGDPGGG
jgi:ketosteroid isomerase-like protein